MILLKEIYSEPEGLFDKVKFKKGINIIYGKQINEGNEKPSLNSIGKSTLISLIDFCLLSSFDKNHKLFKARNFLDQYKIVLKIEVNNEIYFIKRSTAEQKSVFFSKEGDEEKQINLEDAKRILYKNFFDNEKYEGTSNNKWFRTIIPLYIRDEKKGFDNPLEYIPDVKKQISTVYHLMLMNIDNRLSIKNDIYIRELEKRKKEMEGVKELIESQYGDLEAINNKLDKLKKEIEVAEISKEKFHLDKSYQQEEEHANEITKKIKEIIFQNNSLRNLLENYKESYRLEIDIDPKKISSIYEEINKELGLALRKTLDQAINFKNSLIESRKGFIKNKIEETEQLLTKNSELIKNLDEERSKIFNFLENKKAIKDLTELFNFISDKKKVYEDLNGKISLIKDLEKIYLKKKTEYAKLQEDMNEFINNIKSKVSSLREIYNEIYSSLYASDEKEGFFDIIFDKGKKCKICIIASSKDADGFGKNRGCILVYDLTLLFNTIKENLPYPRFWVHDGIFNGIYKNQFISTMNLLNKKSAELDFQYITTLNEDEENIGDSKFGKLNFELKDNIIVTYTNKIEGKIFKREF